MSHAPLIDEAGALEVLPGQPYGARLFVSLFLLCMMRLTTSATVIRTATSTATATATPATATATQQPKPEHSNSRR